MVYRIGIRLITLTCLVVMLFQFMPALTVHAQDDEEPPKNHVGFPAVYPPPSEPPETPPFSLPFQGPPGPSTWFLGQPYGNTRGAFILREMFYLAGQGF